MAAADSDTPRRVRRADHQTSASASSVPGSAASASVAGPPVTLRTTAPSAASSPNRSSSGRIQRSAPTGSPLTRTALQCGRADRRVRSRAAALARSAATALSSAGDKELVSWVLEPAVPVDDAVAGLGRERRRLGHTGKYGRVFDGVSGGQGLGRQSRRQRDIPAGEIAGVDALHLARDGGVAEEGRIVVPRRLIELFGSGGRRK